MKIAVVGGGGIGSTHARAYQAIGADLVAVVEPDEDSAQRFRDRFGVVSYSSLNELLSSVDRPDGVSICTPPFAHRELVLHALSAGIHVLCEKPMAHTLTDATAIHEAAQSSSVVFAMAYCHRFQPEVEHMREQIEEGRIGEPRTFHNSFSGYQENVQTRWLGSKELSGGGVLIDAGIHSIDIFRYLCGDVHAITGVLSTALGSQTLDVEHTAAISLLSVRDVVGSIECSWKTVGEEAIVRVTGEKGSLTFDYSHPGDVVLLTSEGLSTLRVPTGDRFECEVRDFVDAIETGGKSRSSSGDGLAGVVAVTAVYNQTAPTGSL